MREQREALSDPRPGSVTRMRSIGQGQVVDLVCGCEYDISEVGIIEGSDAEPGHKKRPNRGDWA